MAQVSGTLKTTDAIGNREQLLDTIYMVYRKELPFTANICGRASASATNPNWQTDDIEAANAANAATEGADAGTASNYNPTRIGSYTQIFEKVAKVARTQEVVKKAGRDSEMGRQMRLKTVAILRDLEAAATCEHAGASGATRRLRGLESWLTTNTKHGEGGSTNSSTGTVTDGSARSLTKGLVDDSIQQIVDAGGNPTDILVGSFNKRVLSDELNGSAVNNRQINAEKAQVNQAVDVYMSEFGQIKITFSPQQRAQTLFTLQNDMFDVAFLDPLQNKNLPSNGHYEAKLLWLEATLISRNEKASGKIADLTVA